MVGRSCATEHCSVKCMPLVCSQALHKYIFSLDFMDNGIGNLFSHMLIDTLRKYLFGCTQLAGKLDIMPLVQI